MSGLAFSVLGVTAKQYAAVPALLFRLRIACTGEPVEAIALRVQIRIEPQWRSYSAQQEPLLEELFGTPDRWGKTLHALSWADVPLMVPAFAAQTEIELPVPCTFDFDVAANRFLNALDGGEIPLRFFFSGSVFRRAAQGFSGEPVSWSCESAFGMPLSAWHQAMQACYGDSALIRVDAQTFRELHRYRAAAGAHSWDAAFASLLKAAKELT
ncbi:MAG: DUF6084 family protein [Candidatus Baltobacteraceae bacterium]